MRPDRRELRAVIRKSFRQRPLGGLESALSRAGLAMALRPGAYGRVSASTSASRARGQSEARNRPRTVGVGDGASHGRFSRVCVQLAPFEPVGRSPRRGLPVGETARPTRSTRTLEAVSGLGRGQTSLATPVEACLVAGGKDVGL